MGWCSGTKIFDSVAGALLEDGPHDKKAILIEVIEALEYADWDCQQDSDYWDHPVVQDVMKELHPRWFEEEQE